VLIVATRRSQGRSEGMRGTVALMHHDVMCKSAGFPWWRLV
jgi:hypothetical protein